MTSKKYNARPSSKGGYVLTKPGPGRPPAPKVSEDDIAGLAPDDLVEQLFQTLAFDVVRLRRSVRRGELTDKQARRVSFLARAVETCAKAKRDLIEAAKAEDLSKLPIADLARIVVREMRKAPELQAAVAAELERAKPKEEARPA